MRTLVLTGSAADAEVEIGRLRDEGFHIDAEVASDRAGLEEALERGPVDLVISEYELGDFNGMQALERVRSIRPESAFVMLSGALGEERAIECIRAGADDLVSKADIGHLGAAVDRALAEASGRVGRQRAEQTMATALAFARGSQDLGVPETVSSGLEAAMQLSGSTVSAFRLVGPSAEESEEWKWGLCRSATGRLLQRIGVDVASCQAFVQAVETRSAVKWDFTEGGAKSAELPKGHAARASNSSALPEGHVRLGRSLFVPVVRDDSVFAVIAVSNKPTEYDENDEAALSLLAETLSTIVARKESEERLKESERLKEALLANMVGVAYRCGPGYPRLASFISQGVMELLGESPQEIAAAEGGLDRFVIGDDEPEVRHVIEHVSLEGGRYEMEYRVTTPTGEKWVRDQGRGTRGTDGSVESLEGLMTDVTEHKKLEEALIVRERQVHSAYSDVLHAVTQGKLVLADDVTMDAEMGELVASFEVPSAAYLQEARSRLRKEIDSGALQCAQSPGDVILAFGEAITNGVKHAGSCSVWIRLRYDSVGCSHIQLVITDSGPGIDFADLPKATLMAGYSTKRSLGFGFTVMLDICERVLLTTSRHGTRVVLEFACNCTSPLEKAPKAVLSGLERM